MIIIVKYINWGDSLTFRNDSFNIAGRILISTQHLLDLGTENSSVPRGCSWKGIKFWYDLFYISFTLLGACRNPDHNRKVKTSLRDWIPNWSVVFVSTLIPPQVQGHPNDTNASNHTMSRQAIRVWTLLPFSLSLRSWYYWNFRGSWLEVPPRPRPWTVCLCRLVLASFLGLHLVGVCFFSGFTFVALLSFCPPFSLLADCFVRCCLVGLRVL